MRYLLDTNAVSDMISNPEGRIAERVASLEAGSVCTSVIVAAELRFGAEKRKSARLTSRVERMLGSMAVLAFEAPADVAYGRIRAALERAGRPNGGNDLFIAAHAVAEGCVLVTANVREFARVDGLVVENWLEAV